MMEAKCQGLGKQEVNPGIDILIATKRALTAATLPIG